ncbi:MAG: ATP-binding protein [Lachnospiraceae bacterium]|nr:ATP-binding protein [Lachnospiraceae bacterium]
MLEQSFPAEDAALSKVIAFAEEELEKAECPMRTLMQITVSIEEIFVNIARYAYPEKAGEMLLGIDYDDCEKIFTFRFRDQGIPFNPLDKPDPDVTLPAEERKVGGLGIFLMKKNMDGYSYTHENNENILTMWKKI